MSVILTCFQKTNKIKLATGYVMNKVEHYQWEIRSSNFTGSLTLERLNETFPLV